MSHRLTPSRATCQKSGRGLGPPLASRPSRVAQRELAFMEPAPSRQSAARRLDHRKSVRVGIARGLVLGGAFNLYLKCVCGARMVRQMPLQREGDSSQRARLGAAIDVVSICAQCLKRLVLV